MLRAAEQYQKLDEQVKSVVSERNALEAYCFQLKEYLYHPSLVRLAQFYRQTCFSLLYPSFLLFRAPLARSFSFFLLAPSLLFASLVSLSLFFASLFSFLNPFIVCSRFLFALIRSCFLLLFLFLSSSFTLTLSRFARFSLSLSFVCYRFVLFLVHINIRVI